MIYMYWDLGGPKTAQLLKAHNYRSTPRTILIKLNVISLQHDFNHFVTSQKHWAMVLEIAVTIEDFVSENPVDTR